MAKINLLPWRAERRERRKREFFTQLILAVVAAIVLVLLWSFWMSLRIDNQDNRNTYLKGQIQQLDAKISEIKNLQKVKDHLLARKKIVEKLQASRSQMVHLFDQIVKTIPSGARLTSMQQKGDQLTLNGVAQSNATVADYMRNIEASPWMGPAKLIGTENVQSDSRMPYEFQLVVTLGTPKPDEEGGNGEGGQTPAAASSAAAPATAAASAGAPATPAALPKAAASVAGASGPAPLPAALPSPQTTAPAPAGSAPAANASTAASGSADAAKPAQLPAASVTKGGAGS